MDLILIGLHFGVFAASLLQAATGVGFGIIAGPLLLIVMASASAIQVSILLSLFISAIIVPTLRKSIDGPLLLWLTLGSFAGLPIGIYLFLQINLNTLKTLAGLVVLYMAVKVWRSGTVGKTASGQTVRRGRLGDIATGILSGAMATSLAMPGPPVASRLMLLARPRDVVRATLLALFVISYSAAILVQAAAAGVDQQTLIDTAVLLPATALGLVVGRKLADKFSDDVFRRVISTILVFTAAALLINSLVSGFQAG